MSRTEFLFLWAALIVFLGQSCGGGDDGAQQPNPGTITVQITTTQSNLVLGASTQPQFSVRVVDGSGKVIANPSVVWTSGDNNIVIIDSKGQIQTKAIGTTEIVATYSGVSDAVEVSVIPPEGEGDFNFVSDGATLVATVQLPNGEGPFPSVVLVHGSGTGARGTLQAFVNVFTNNGVAVLFYDKRGTGESEGNFFEVGPSQSGIDRVRQLGRDALAALKFMKMHSQAGSVGLFGWSQAGWVIPSAVAQSDISIDFMVNAVGPTCTVGEEIYYSSLVANGSSIAEANAQVANFTGVHGYDPVPDLEGIDIPGLWVLGGKDGSIPSEVTRDRLEILIGNGKPYEIHFYPEGNHFLQDANSGAQISYLSGSGGAIDWIKGIVN